MKKLLNGKKLDKQFLNIVNDAADVFHAGGHFNH